MLLTMPPLAAEILAGYVAGSAKTAAFYPLDTLTTLRETRVPSSERSLLQRYSAANNGKIYAASWMMRTVELTPSIVEAM